MSIQKRVFISYGTADASIAASWLQSELSRRGYRVWRDKDKLRDGEDWASTIERELLEADAVVALLSPHAVRHGGECRNEIAVAKDNRKTIIPVMVRRCEPPLRIYELQRVDLENFDGMTVERREEQLRRIIDAIERGVPEDPGITQVRSFLPRLDFQWMFSRHDGFVGREWLLDAFDRWIERGTQPALFLVGPAGIGKSAALCRWVQTRMDIGAVHFCRSDRMDLRDPVKMVASIASQLVTIQRELPGYAEGILAPALDAARQPVDSGRAAELFDRLVCDPIRGMREGRKWVLVVDALDEGGPDIVHLLADCVREGRLPPNLRLLVSSRPEPALLGLFGNKQVIHAQSSENVGDLRKYVALRMRTIADARGWSPDLAARIADRVVTNAGGLFSFAVSAMDSLACGSMSPTDLDNLSSGNEALYLSIFSKMFPTVDGFDGVASMLEVIVASPSHVSDGLIADVLDVPQRAVATELAKLGSLLRDVDGVRVPFHRSLVDWLKAGSNGRHPFGIQSMDGVRRLRSWHDRKRTTESAILVADALMETRQPREAAEVLRGASRGAVAPDHAQRASHVVLARKLAVAERAAVPGPAGVEIAIRVLQSALEVLESACDPGAPILRDRESNESRQSDILDVHEQLARLFVEVGKWESARESARAAVLLRDRFGLPVGQELRGLLLRCDREVAYARGRPGVWGRRNSTAGLESSSPLRRLLTARGITESDLVSIDLAAMFVDEQSLEEYGVFDDDLFVGDPGDSAGAVPSNDAEAGVAEIVDSKFVAAIVKAGRVMSAHALQRKQIEIVCSPSLGAITAGAILSNMVGAMRDGPACRPRIEGPGFDEQGPAERRDHDCLTIFVGRRGRCGQADTGQRSYSICDGTAAIREEGGRDLGAGIEQEGGPCLVASCIALAIAANRFAEGVADAMPEIAALGVLGSVEDERGWTLVRYFHSVALEGLGDGKSLAIAALLGGPPASPLAAYHHLLDRFARMTDLVRAGEGQLVADLLCLGSPTSSDQEPACKLASALLSDELAPLSLPGIRARLDRLQPLAVGRSVVEIPFDPCASVELPALVGAAAREFDALVIGLRQDGPSRFVCHAASRRVRDLRTLLESSLGLLVDFLPTTLGDRCDFVIAGKDRELLLDRVGALAGHSEDVAGSSLHQSEFNPDSVVDSFDSYATIAELTGDLGLGCALLMPFAGRNPFPVFLVEPVTVTGMQAFGHQSEWRQWGWVELDDGSSSVRVLCFLDSPAWNWMASRFSGDLSHAVPMALEVLLVSLPLQRIEGVVAFELHAVQFQDGDRVENQDLFRRRRISEVLSVLPAREREIVKLRFGYGDGFSYTGEEIGRIFKVTAARVQEVIDSALEKLRVSGRLGRLREILNDG